MTRFLLVLSALCAAESAQAEAITSVAEDAVKEGRHAAYIELFGKGGLYGIGYDYSLTSRLSLGAAVSYSQLDGERITAVAPYLGVRLLGQARHRWFAHLGPELVRHQVRSPVQVWEGSDELSVGAEVSSGYEYRGLLLFRVYAMGAAGRGGITPWFGASLGMTF